MKQTIVFADIRTLIDHEQVDRARLGQVRKQLLAQKEIRRPVMVDKASNVVLDGHHRVQALREIGVKRVPVVYVRYQDEGIRVYLRRKELFMKIIKEYVIGMARSGRVFPSKTTRHLIHGRPYMKPMKLTMLMK